ncbi:choice-of-anchor I family protein, partial [Chlorobium limicola]
MSESKQHTLIGSITLPGSEITAYHAATRTAFVIGGNDELYVVSLLDPFNPVLRATIELAGKAQSVAVNADGLVAVAVDREATVPGSTATYHADGLVQFFTISGTTLIPAGQVTVGSLPDSIAFNEDGTRLVTANEGEPNMFYTQAVDSMDPLGSISIIEVNAAAPGSSAVTTLTFEDYNDQLEQLRNKGIRISGDDAADGIQGNLVAQDMEPEYVSISGGKAYVSLQENNAIAVVDLTTKKIVAIHPVGLKDWNSPDLDVDTSDKDGGIDPGQRSFFGMRMPDGIDTYEYNGETFVVMANEGDGRIRPDLVNFEVPEAYDKKYLKLTDTLPGGVTPVDSVTDPLTNETIYVIETDKTDSDAEKVKKGAEYFLTMKYGWESGDDFYSDESRLYKLDDNYSENDEIGRLKVVNTETDGDPIIGFGGRSFSIMDSKGNIVYDSGDLTEQAAIAAGVYDDGRSDDKGTEPENVTLAEVDGRIYAYVGLERANSVVVFDVTNPYEVEFVELIDVEGDTGFVSPEGLVTGSGLLIVSNEVEPGLAIYALPDTPTVERPLEDVTVQEDSKLEHIVLADAFADIEEGDSLTYTATLADGSPLPGWLQFSASHHDIETLEDYFLPNGNPDNATGSGPATDSASAGTAIATGVKTVDGNIAWERTDNAGGEIETIAETLRNEMGYAIGVASTVPFSHATPAAFVSHDVSRNNYWDIAHEILFETQPEVVIGGGYNNGNFAKATKDAAGVYHDANGNNLNDDYDAFKAGTDGTSYMFVERETGTDGGDALAATAAGVSLADGEKLFGLFGTSGGNFEYYEVSDTPGSPSITRGIEDPTLADVTNASLSVLN